MSEVSIGKYVFGNGNPKICIPVMGHTKNEILRHAREVMDECERLDEQYADYPELSVAVIEWRADFFDDLGDSEALLDTLSALREMFSDRLLLFTFRTEEEGGELRHDRIGSHLGSLYEEVAKSGLIDLLDIEVSRGNYIVARATKIAHDNGVNVIMSYHNFQKTPHDLELETKLRNMEILGADILKIAVMPKNEFDTRRVMDLNKSMAEKCFKPVVIISMGAIGMPSRFKGHETTACLTFASVSGGSAPGQLEVADLVALLKNQM